MSLNDQPAVIEDVLAEFFTSVAPQHVHGVLHEMVDAIEIGKLALLPRAELAQRAALAADLKREIAHLYEVLVLTWGEDPTGWPIQGELREALGTVLSMHMATEHDHTSQSGVASSGIGAMNSHRRRERH